MRYLIRATICFLFFAAFSCGCILAQQASGYRLLHEYKLSGDTGWDYHTMDASSRRLYISRGTHVQVINIDNGKLEGDIPDLKGVHGIALDKADNKGYIRKGGFKSN